MNRCRWLFACAVFAVLAPGLVSRADAPNVADLLRKAEKQYEQLEHEAALETLTALARTRGLTNLQRARYLLYKGVCHVALGEVAEARDAFVGLVRLRPQFRLPKGVSPAIEKTFVQALKKLGLPIRPGKDTDGHPEVTVSKGKGSRARLVVDVRPGWAEVWIDGRRVGYTPYNRRIRPGAHEVRIRAAQFKRDRRYTFQVKPATRTKIEVLTDQANKETGAGALARPLSPE